MAEPASPHPGYFTAGLAAVDHEVRAAVGGELARQQEQIGLIASGNIVSLAVLGAQGPVFTGKTVAGCSGPRYYGGASPIYPVLPAVAT